MIGAIIGDIVGSRFEWDNHRSKEFDLFAPNCEATDDSIMTLALAEAILACDGNYQALGEAAVRSMQRLGRKYPHAGYGGSFGKWLHLSDPKPYDSYGNGAAMRVSPCAWAAGSFGEACLLARKVTEVSHNHEEGLKGAEATTAAIWMARQGEDIPAIRAYINRHYYPLDFTLDSIRYSYRFDETCQGTVPQAITAFLESTDFEDAIRGAVSIGGDSDTLAAITGAIAQAYYGVPEGIRQQALPYLDQGLRTILFNFERQFPLSRVVAQ